MTKFNGTLESNKELELGTFTGNYNFSFNFALKLDLDRLPNSALDSNKLYQIANIDSILKIYLKNYAGEVRLYFHLLASLEPETDLKHFPINAGEIMLVTVSKNNQVNWAYHIYYSNTNTDNLIKLANQPISNFIKGSKLILGGDKSQNILSFPGDIGPIHFSNIDTYEAIPDPKCAMTMFYRAQSTVLYRLFPLEVKGKSRIKNLMHLRNQPDSTLSSYVQTVTGANFTTVGDDIQGITLISMYTMIEHAPASNNGEYNGIDLEQFRETQVITVTFWFNIVNIAAYPLMGVSETYLRFDLYGKKFILSLTPVKADGNAYLVLNEETLNITLGPYLEVG